jgi:DNA repair protein RadC
LADVSPLLAFLFELNKDRQDEFVHAFFINRAGQLAWSETLASGQKECAQIELRRLICTALRADATGLILAHNHPSGTAQPSPRDVTSTLDLQRICRKVGIELIDHVIVAARGFFSFKAERILQVPA